MQDNVIIAYIDSSLLDFWNSIESMTMYPSPCHKKVFFPFYELLIMYILTPPP